MASSSIPDTMKGVIIEKTGGPEVLEYRTDIPVPVPKEGEALIKNSFIGINFIDINFRNGTYPTPLPHIPGVEAEGTIISISLSPSMTTNLVPGTRVAYISTSTYAEYSICSLSKIYPLPPTLDPGLGATCLSQGLTALTFIRSSYSVQKDEWILVQGASGGVGIWLCRLLRSIGARVIGTASSTSKLSIAKNHGAEFVINYTTENIEERVMDITNGKGVSAVFDSIGASTFSSSMASLAQNGTMVSIGNTSGAITAFNITDLSKRNLKLMKPSVFGYISTEEAFTGLCDELFGFVLREGVRREELVWRVYELEDVREAHADLEGRGTVGKLLLRV